MKIIALAVYVLLLSSSAICQVFSFKQTITANDKQTGDVFGFQLTINQMYGFASADLHGYDDNGLNYKNSAGAAYVYFFNVPDSTYDFKQKLVPSDRNTGDRFGLAVACTDSFLAVSSPEQDLDDNQTNLLLNSGATYVYKRDGTGKWSENQKLVASDRRDNDRLGNPISMFNKYLAISSTGNDYDNSSNFEFGAGAIYVFERQQNGQYAEIQKVTNSDRDSADTFGSCITFLSDSEMVVGAINQDYDHNGANYVAQAGAAYYFVRDISGSWIEKQKIVAPIRDSADFFGTTVVSSGEYLAIGAYNEDYDESNQNYVFAAGAVYLFKRNVSGLWNFYQKITAPFRTVNMSYARNLIMEDSIIVVGANTACMNLSNTDSLTQAGAAFVYVMNSLGNWNFSQMLILSPRNIGDKFGSGVAYHEGKLFVGATSDETDSVNNTGSVTVFAILSDGPLGTQDEAEYSNGEEGLVRVYPNPTVGDFTIDAGNEQILGLEIHDLSGKLIYRGQVTDHPAHVSFPLNTPEGLYHAKIQFAEQTISKGLILKRD